MRFVNGSPEGSPSVVVLRGVPACLSFEFSLRCIALSICKGRRGSIPRRVWRDGCFAGSPSLRPCLVCYVCRVLFDLGLALQPWSCSSLVWTLGIAPRPPYRLKDKKNLPDAAKYKCFTELLHFPVFFKQNKSSERPSSTGGLVSFNSHK